MRNHTATHIINGAAQKVLGTHVWQEGADKTPEKARLDLSHYKHVTHSQLQEIEMIANQITIQGAVMIAAEESIGNIKMKLNAIMPSNDEDEN